MYYRERKTPLMWLLIVLSLPLIPFWLPFAGMKALIQHLDGNNHQRKLDEDTRTRRT